MSLQFHQHHQHSRWHQYAYQCRHDCLRHHCLSHYCLVPETHRKGTLQLKKGTVFFILSIEIHWKGECNSESRTSPSMKRESTSPEKIPHKNPGISRSTPRKLTKDTPSPPSPSSTISSAECARRSTPLPSTPRNTLL